MNAIFKALTNYLLLPLLKDAGVAILNWLEKKWAQHKTNKSINKEVKKLKQSKDKDEVLDAIRNLNI